MKCFPPTYRRSPKTQWHAECSQGLCVGPSDHINCTTGRLLISPDFWCHSPPQVTKKKRRLGQISGTNSEFIIEFGSLAWGRVGERRREKTEETESGVREEESRDRSSVLGPRCQWRRSFCSVLIILSTSSSYSFFQCLSIIYEGHYQLWTVIAIPPVMMRREGEQERRMQGRAKKMRCDGRRRSESHKEAVPRTLHVVFVFLIVLSSRQLDVLLLLHPLKKNVFWAKREFKPCLCLSELLPVQMSELITGLLLSKNLFHTQKCSNLFVWVVINAMPAIAFCCFVVDVTI